MFNSIATTGLFGTMILSFIFIYTTRLILIKKTWITVIYYSALSLFFIVGSLAGGSVQNDFYKRLEEFKIIEQTTSIENARNNLGDYDSMMAIDLKAYNTSQEFADDLAKRDEEVDSLEAIAVGLLFVILAELSMLIAKLVSWCMYRIRSRLTQ